MAVNEKNTFANRPIPSSEASRRAKVKACSYYLKIYINGTLMSISDKKSLEWPAFEIEFKHLFQIFIYTKPYSIAVEVCSAGLFDQVVDRVELEIPGDHSNSLTSASSIFRDVPYCKKRLLKAPASTNKSKEADPKPGNPAGTNFEDKHNSNDPVRLLDQDGKPDHHKRDEPLKADDQQDTDSTEADLLVEVLESGRISVEVGWKGFGPQLPPLNTGGFGIFRQRKKAKGGYTSVPQEEEELMRDEVLLDVNDPRNYDRVERIREIRNNYLRSLLHSDMKIPLNDIPSLRHEFMKLSLLTYDSKVKHMPLLESEVFHNRPICDALVKHFNDKSSLLKENRSSPQEPLNMANITKVEGFLQSPEAQKRITETKLTFLKKQGEIRVKKNLGVSDTVSLLGVINEFRFGDEENHFLQNLMKIFEPRRKLRPQVSKPKKVSANQRKECIIVVQVIKGMNIPARFKSPSGNALELSAIQNANIAASTIRARGGDPGMAVPIVPTRDPDGSLRLVDDDRAAFAEENALFDSDRYKLPSSFVQTAIVDKSHEATKLMLKTGDTFDGTDPEWNENLSLIYSSKNDKGFTNLELLKNEATLYVSVFDNFGSYERHNENDQRFSLKIEKRFLGNIKIPLLSLFVNSKVDSMFRLNRPIYLFGYLSSKANAFSTAQQDALLTTIDPFTPTYVMLSLACEPNFELPEADSAEYSPGFEPTQFLLAGKAFLEKFFDQPGNKSRHLRLWGYNIEGKSIFIPRYISPMKPPEEFYTKDPGAALGSVGNGPGVVDLEDDIYQKCARFVSLIPVKNDNSFFSDMPDIFMTGQEFIDMLAGDFEEHAILLCNYFLYIDHVLKGNKHIESMVILGRGVPEGKTYYVLRRDTKTDRNELWNPVTGDIYVFNQKKLTTKFLCFTCNAGVTQQSGCTSSSPSHRLHLSAQVRRRGRLCFERVHQRAERHLRRGHPVGREQPQELPALPQVRLPHRSKRATEKFFPKGISSVQTDIVYEETNAEFLTRLERKIAQYIAGKVEEHRFSAVSNGKQLTALATKWNKNFGDQIRHQLLHTFEMFKYSMRPAGIDGMASKAKVDQAAEQMATIKKVRLSHAVDHGAGHPQQRHLRLPAEHALRVCGADLGRGAQHGDPQHPQRRHRVRPLRRHLPLPQLRAVGLGLHRGALQVAKLIRYRVRAA